MKHLSARELATRWTMSIKTLANWRSDLKGPKFMKLGARVVYDQADVEAYERTNKHLQGVSK
ncbi:MAG: DNA-binding protein [Oxalobacteraceae bacterium]|nr:MAG: DNA-binding protein [Oxalobacteraceae bacterium]